MTYVAAKSGVKMMSVAELLRKLKESADCYNLESTQGWFYMLESKLADPQTPSIIRAIEEFGFLDPICITKEYAGWKLGNGHHRLAIAIMLGLDEIPVDFSSWYSRGSTAHSSNLKRIYGDARLADWIASFWTNAEEGYDNKG
jgi:ParB-like nuclease family protein